MNVLIRPEDWVELLVPGCESEWISEMKTDVRREILMGSPLYNEWMEVYIPRKVLKNPYIYL
ncbi:hypothetical protein G9F72_021620 [Clostridium estertheticum]|uniref:hypothetical protein n=1 Tax=Clostridium estertheticum TaxID=238834 RepID=UPI0013E990B5|nr:hypothetical protein [Clostridium estertheticum]MBZ9688921.1 hypothetical protein [Clostridium estertheticum]